MGTFRYPMEIGNQEVNRFESLDALVDTGATYTVVPADILRKLKVTVHDRVAFLLADGRQIERDLGQTWVRIGGKRVITLEVSGEEGAQTLLGAYTLEGLRLGVNPLNRRLVPTPGLLMTSTSCSPTMKGRSHLTGVSK